MGQHKTRDRILQFISDFTDANGYTPSYREIALAVGLQSTSTVARHINNLKKNGKLIAVSDSKGRNLRLNRNIALYDASGCDAQRVQIEVADGGVLCIDCNLKNRDSDHPEITFSGILDANQLKSSVSRIIRCRVETDDE